MYFFVKSWIICVENITESNARCQTEVFWMKKSDYNCWKWIIPYIFIINFCEKWKWPLVSLTSIFSASTWPNVKSKDSFEKLRTSRLQNWPSFLNMVKIWWRYGLRKKSVRILFSTSVCVAFGLQQFFVRFWVHKELNLKKIMLTRQLLLPCN